MITLTHVTEARQPAVWATSIGRPLARKRHHHYAFRLSATATTTHTPTED